ncbi:hypothetical protein NDN08_003074 [Rhodosorus marinus]|uniref:Nuclease associated modular domain-containing protein n=1 Tax=Rhodosorus marinus TaxID=101924 RepID=A0AAV8V1A2_9RHOD|nr:hypothetical protein NDN08_003074 [Rhodosorus marinus]
MLLFVGSIGGFARSTRTGRVARHCSQDVAEEGGKGNTARREKMKALWSDPEWRARVLAKRRSRAAIEKQSKSMSKKWEDDEFRTKVQESLKGKEPWNKGVPMPDETKRRISVVLRGSQKSPETRAKMSQAKQSVPMSQEGKNLISNQKRGKTKDYYKLKSDYELLKNDLQLWADSHRLKTGRPMREKDINSLVKQSHLLTKIKKYLELKGELIKYDSRYEHDDPIIR